MGTRLVAAAVYFSSWIIVSVAPINAQEPVIYWEGAVEAGETRATSIFRYTPGGVQVDTLLRMTTLSPDFSRSLFGVSVDTLNNHVYWLDSGGPNADGVIELGAMGRMSLAGLDPQVILSPLSGPMCSPRDIEFDHDGGRIFWGSSCSGSGLHVISMEELDASQIGSLPMRASYVVSAIEVDVPGNMIYWVNRDFFGVEPDGIVRAQLSDTETDEYVVVGSVCDVVLARKSAKLYWTTCGSGVIRQSNLDGSNTEVVLDAGAEIGRLAIDEGANRIYWTETVVGTIRRANLIGTGVETVLTGLVVPESIALSPNRDVHTGSEPADILPEDVGFGANVYPNPVQDRASVDFTLSTTSRVTLTLHDVLGRQVDAALSNVYPAGRNSVEWDLTRLSGGLYFLYVTTGHEFETFPIVVRR